MLSSAPRNLLLLVLSTALWAVLFRVACALSQRHVRVYRDFSRAEQGDWSSRCVLSLSLAFVTSLSLD